MEDVHGIAALPDSAAPGRPGDRANIVVPAYFGHYEETNDLPVVRPVRIERVTNDGDLLVAHAGDRTWTTRTLVNATGTWSQPHLPYYPGLQSFRGEQLHTAGYPGAGPLPRQARDRRRRRRIGGPVPRRAGAGQRHALGHPSPAGVAHRGVRPGRRARGRRPGRGAGPPRTPAGQRRQRDRTGAARAGARGRARSVPTHDARCSRAIEPDGVRMPDGSFEPADVILWATGFRPAITHLAPLHLRSEHGGIQLDGTTAVADPRVQLVGYGPSASTIGANRAGRVAAARRRLLVGSSVGQQRFQRLTVGQGLWARPARRCGRSRTPRAPARAVGRGARPRRAGRSPSWSGSAVAERLVFQSTSR